MGIEIERKFLTKGDDWRLGAVATPYVQGYLTRGRGRTVRIRIAGASAYLTVKGPVSGIARPEYEYSIPVADAREMLHLCEGPLIEKNRHRIQHGHHVWEVDEFFGDNAGLIVAEVELSSPDEPLTIPFWIDREVTGDPRYYNSNLTVHPFGEWNPQTV